MGAVYEAEHIHMKKSFALKVLHRSMSTDPEVVARFEREAVAAGRLSHPGIVAATDFGRLLDGSFYLALELVNGRALSAVLEEIVVFPPERAFQIAFQVNSVLEAAHSQGIIHRDIKPENIMLVASGDPEDFVKVLDFGIAKIRIDGEENERITQAGLVFGTPEYMSPEQAKGYDADARSDLYGVGMLLYEMLVGQSPFYSEELTEMLTAQITEIAPELPDEVPLPLRSLVARLLKKDPEERPQTATELDGELRNLAGVLDFRLPSPRTSTGTRLLPMGSSPVIELPQHRPSLALAALHSMQSFSIHPVAIGNKRVPFWIPALSLMGGLSLGAYLALLPALAPSAPVATPQSAVADVEVQLLEDVRSGDRDAVSELRKSVMLQGRKLSENQEKMGAVPPARSSEALASQANRYLALGRGYSVIKHYSAAIEMYRQAVQLDPYLAEDSELLLDVRVAIAARDAVDDGLDFALTALGSHGADLIYDVYLDHLGEPGKTPVVARAMKLVNGTELVTHATPELRVALRLLNAKLCGEFREILPDAVENADERSLEPLRGLLSHEGCGAQRKEDCYECLRNEDVPLEAAIKRAETHPAPSFLGAPSSNIPAD